LLLLFAVVVVGNALKLFFQFFNFKLLLLFFFFQFVVGWLVGCCFN